MFDLKEVQKFKRKRPTKYLQGHFQPKNPGKYVGDHRQIVYRSSWELRFMIWCDTKPTVLSWSSEETIIPYVSPVDKRGHRYFVDFKIKVATKNGPKTILIEIKPEKQTRPPEKPKKVGPNYQKSVLTYMVNAAKWDAARKYCEPRGLEFMVLTERDLFD